MSQTTRMQITVSDELVADIDEYARDVGISRNAICAMLLKQSIDSYLLNKQTISKNKKEEEAG